MPRSTPLLAPLTTPRCRALFMVALLRSTGYIVHAAAHAAARHGATVKREGGMFRGIGSRA